MKKAKKKVLKGKNKFIRLDEANLKYVEKKAKSLARSQNWFINKCIDESRIKYP